MLPGLEADPKRILTNIEILDLKQVPKSLAIIGAGAVGVEFASIFRSFGSEVTILEMLPRLVPVEDQEVSKELARAFRKKGIQLEVGAKVDKVTNSRGGVDLDYVDAQGAKKKLSAEKLLVAIGRKPNTEKVGIENTKIEMDRDFVVTDQWMRTAEQGVYAIGDIVAGTPQLAHTAQMEGLVVVARIAGKPVEPINYLQNPGATYCEPQIGSVGLTEAKAREKGFKVKIGKFPFGGNSKASILGQHGGFVKVVADEKYGEILGVHIIGPAATELISEAVVAMSSEATVESMMSTIHAHPTLSEAVQEGFNSVYGLSINA
jgi:dihydrolipoamide dehydrogenase